MSTVCKLCVAADEREVIASLGAFLSARLPGDLTPESSEWPKATDRESWIIAYDDPTVLSVRQADPGFIEVFFNSFSRVEDLALHLSAGSRLVVNQYQSVTTSSYWAYYLDGELIREIEAGDGEVSGESGTPLEFESDPVGHDISEEGEEALFIFDDSDMDQYNEGVGIPVAVYRPPDPGWTNFVLPEKAAPSPPEKRGWKFWKR